MQIGDSSSWKADCVSLSGPVILGRGEVLPGGEMLEGSADLQRSGQVLTMCLK